MPPKKRLLSLQVYRAMAALLVVLYHLTDQSSKRFDYSFLGGAFVFGYTGVDFFFVLSGFIIFFVHSQDIGRPHRLVSYLQKRFVRIYPIYWIIAGAKLAALLALPAIADSAGSGVRYFISSFLLLPQRVLPIVGVAWTLSYELLFYLLFAVAIAYGWRWIIWGMGLWSAAIIAHATGFFPGVLAPKSFFVEFLLNERNLEFLIGCLIALVTVKRPLPGARFLVIAGAAYYVLSGLFVNSQNGEPPATFVLTFGLASALLVAGSVSLEMQAPLKWPKWLTFLGDASYSIYLTHALFMSVWFIAMTRLGMYSYFGPLVTILIIAILSVLGSCVTYVYIERPVTAFLGNVLSKKALYKHSCHQTP